MSDHALLRYCPDLLAYNRRKTREVMVGKVGIGGGHPIRVQSMITSDTRDTPACVAEVLQLAEAGCEIVRITAQTKIYAANLENIAREVRAAGCQVPLVADIHFKPDAALEAARWVEKVRVNPGNYVDKKKFAVREYSDDEYAGEVAKIREEFIPLVELCKSLGRAMRIGTNHGSLSDRIMNYYGDSPLGMVESALEFARIAREFDYHNFVFSMKASNPKVMIEAYRLLVARLDREGPDWNYPIHLGVTEAGDGEDGRIKSAIGIGSLLADGIGDTIRVSLTEDAVHEIPVAQALAAPFNKLTSGEAARSGEAGSGEAARSWGVSPQSVQGASRPLNLPQAAATIHPDWSQLTRKTSTHLPHWRIPGATYAVTFRLDDALPESALREYRERREILARRMEIELERAGSRDALKPVLQIRADLEALQIEVIETALQQGHGKCHLRDAAIATLVKDALQFFDTKRYELVAWSVMPNHVHVILRPMPGHELEEIVQSWKSFTAKKANALLGKSGTFWQEEYYDHLIRDGEDFEAQVRYVLENPLKGRATADWTGSVFGDTWAEVLGARRPKDGLGQDAPATDDVLGARRPKDGLGQDAPATGGAAPAAALAPSYDPFSYERRRSSAMEIMGHALGGVNVVRVFTAQEKWNAVAHKIEKMGDFKPEIIVEKSGVVEIDPRDEAALSALNHGAEVHLVTVKDGLDLDVIPAFRMLACRLDARHPILLKDVLQKSGCGVSPQASDDLRGGAAATFIRPDLEIDRTKGTYLPHWTQDGGVYAINFRLADSLPQTALNDYLRDRTELEQMLADEKARMKSGEDSSILSSLAHKLSNLYESTIGRHLDAGHGECQLRDERIASVIVGALRHFDGDRYRLLAWCVMANHVHLVIQPLGEHLLGDILQSIKSYTAKAANTLLSRSGTFWQRESYDHLIRDGEEYRNQIRYVLENPEKAGLRDWPWRGSVYGATWESVAASQEKDGEGLRRDATATLLTASRHLGSLLCDGIGDAILVQGEPAPGQSLRLSYNILQAAGTRIFKTDYVACPSCGRTLFNLQSTTQKIRASTGHLKGVRIAVMGCIVNGPGEMADADFGYVGGAPGKINLYVGKQAVKFNIPEDEAVERLIDLIREHGKWIDAPAGEPVEV